MRVAILCAPKKIKHQTCSRKQNSGQGALVVSGITALGVLGAASMVVATGAALAAAAAWKLYPVYLKLAGKSAPWDSAAAAKAVQQAALTRLEHDSGTRASYGSLLSAEAPAVVEFVRFGRCKPMTQPLHDGFRPSKRRRWAR